MRPPCDHLARHLPAAARGEQHADIVAPHVASCLRCRLELLRWRRLFRALDALGEDRAELPPGLVAEVLATIETAARESARRTLVTGRRVAYGVACVGAALTGVLVARGRAGTAVGATRPASS